jgi:hypothetical protein
VIHRQSGGGDPTDLLRTLSEDSQPSTSPSLRSSLASESFRGAHSEAEADRTPSGSRGEADVEGSFGISRGDQRGLELGATARASKTFQGDAGESGFLGSDGEPPSGFSGSREDSRELQPSRGARERTRLEGTGQDFHACAEFKNPSVNSNLFETGARRSETQARRSEDGSGTGGLEPGKGRSGRRESGGPLPDFIENFYEGRDGRQQPLKPGSRESVHTTPRSAIKQPIWTGDPVGVNKLRAQPVPRGPEAARSKAPRRPISVNSPSVNRRKPSVREHDASWFDGRMPPLSEDYVVRPSTSPPKEDLGRPWLRNRGSGGSKSRGSLPKKYPRPVGRLLLRDLSVRWRFYGGRDSGCGSESLETRLGGGLRPGSTSGRRDSSTRSKGKTTGGGLVTRSVRASEDGLEGWSTVSVEHGPETKSLGSGRTRGGAFPGAIQPPGRGGRQKENCLEVLLDGVDLQHDSFPQRDHYASRLAVSVRDITVYDFSKSAPWRMIMGHYRSATCPRESGSKALRVEMDAVRPDVTSLLEEYRLMLALLPLRLHLDQRHMDFCADFFAGGAVTPGSPGDAEGGGNGLSKQEADVEEEAFLPFFQVGSFVKMLGYLDSGCPQIWARVVIFSVCYFYAILYRTHQYTF